MVARRAPCGAGRAAPHSLPPATQPEGGKGARAAATCATRGAFGQRPPKNKRDSKTKGDGSGKETEKKTWRCIC